MDETALFLNVNNGLVVAQRGKPALKVGPCNKENITVLISVNANGEQATPLALFAYNRMPDKILDNAPQSVEWSFGKTTSGWMTAEAFFEFITNTFYPFLVKTGIELPVIVFLDGHASHISVPLSQFCRTHGIIPVLLPANTTHILQVRRSFKN